MVCDKWSRDDTKNVLRVLAFKRFVPGVPVYCMLCQKENQKLLEAAGVSPHQIMCIDSLTMGLIGQNIVTPGVSTLLMNLAASLDHSLPEVAKRKRGNADATVGSFNAKACGLELLKSARKVELRRLMRAAEDVPFIDVQQRMRRTDIEQPICPVFVQGLRPLSASRAKLLAGLDARSKYHGTALAAACVESSSTPWRTRARDGVGAGDMRATARRVNADGPFVAVDAWFPCGAVASAGELAREEEAKQRRRAEMRNPPGRASQGGVLLSAVGMAGAEATTDSLPAAFFASNA